MIDVCLTSESAYQTGGRLGHWFGRCYPAAVFYSKILCIVYSASKLAKKDLYDNHHWIESSITTVRSLESVGGRFDLGEKGAIPQRDGQTYAVNPHIPCGLITPELLRRLADVAEKMIDRIGIEPLSAALV